MLGLIALGLISVMILILIKNALLGKQFSSDDTYLGTIELIIPITISNYFPIEEWKRNADSIQRSGNQIKVHLLVNGHHPLSEELNQLKNNYSLFQVHHFASPQQGAKGIDWMINQIKPTITAFIVAIGDAEIVPSLQAFLSLGKNIQNSSGRFLVVPQTSKSSLMGELVNVLNSNLAFASTFNFKKWAQNYCHPILGITRGWMGMKLEDFQKLDFKIVSNRPWKEAIVQQWDESNISFNLAFGEKHLLRFYPKKTKDQLVTLVDYWNELWENNSKRAFYLYLTVLFLWSFPIIFFPTHFFWAIASIFLLVLYRFFSKIVFQESWKSVALHPLSCLFLLSSLTWWLYEMVKKPKES